jgi:hypothetical protein
MPLAKLLKDYGQIPGGQVTFGCGAILLRLYLAQKKFWSILRK